jgi:gliding motility-associated lipoprotein GldH
MPMKKFIYVLLPFILCCTQKHFYSEYKTVDSKNWSSNDTLKFKVDIADSNAVYDVAVSVRYQKTYEFSNVWLNIFTQYADVKKSARLEVPLFKNDGKPYGESSGSLCTQTISFQKQLTFPQTGTYIISVVQLMRKDPIDGISDVGIIIDKK